MRKGVDVLGTYAIPGLEGQMVDYPGMEGGAPHNSLVISVGPSWEWE